MLSIVIPTFNRPDMLSSALRSIRCSNLDLVEVIVCDDRSTEENQAENKRIIQNVINETNIKIQYLENSRTKGVSGARNCAVEKSSGEWILFLDDDDEFYENYIDYVINYVSKNNSVDLFWADAIIQKKLGSSETKLKRVFSPNSMAEFYRDFLSVGLGYGIVVRKQAFMECGMLDENLKVAEDTSLFIEFIKRNKIIKNVPAFGVIIHEHSSEKLTSSYEYHARTDVFRSLFRKNIKVLKSFDLLYCSFSSWIIEVYKQNKMNFKALLFCFEFLFKNISLLTIKQFNKEMGKIFKC